MTSARPLHVWAIRVTLGLGLVAGSAGCDPFTGVDFTPITAEPAGDQVQFSRIRVTEGRAIGVTGTPMQGDEPMDEDTTLVITSRDENVAGIEKSIKDDSFVVFGVSPGKTVFQVTVNDTDEAEIPVEVLEAP